MSLIPVIDYTAANIGELAAKARALRAKMYAPDVRTIVIPPPPVARRAPDGLKRAVSWTPAEIDMLRQMARGGAPRDVIARALLRPPQSIARKAKLLRVKLMRGASSKVIQRHGSLALRNLVRAYRQDMTIYSEVAVARIKPRPQAVIRAIIEEVAARAGLTRDDIISAARTPHIVRARQIAVWLAARETPLSLPHLGRIFGDRDHTTILYTIRRENERRGANVRGAGFVTEHRKAGIARRAGIRKASGR